MKDHASFSTDKRYLEMPLIIRSKRPGDTILLQGGKKTLKKLFNEWQVPVEERWLVPVIADREGIVCVMGDVLGYQNRVSKRAQRNNNHENSSNLTISFIRQK
jgi:tRNA(Ile)-lysidine synthetase-like protein